ncbi:MAG: NAD(P)-binding domain-containing protein [Arcobacter sp.]|jgi:thioredoxin reductase (NADPH)|uniref:NADPH oxidoreductase, putative flavodoxin quinone reductase FqrB n=1 Tax=Arcobacter defluvii TaxID=873191 RepID=A0AAE7BDK7_9BACT|nr:MULTISPECIES: NAD(P)-binding domain-containing protein [Arcobacter]MDY3200523.1 NAD(P)-binding domain-containing protein [Arcobacter sp.]QKF76077.1 NADPH oxidoreductase, putative flavodoxin quinone reductase FqrB [Arcobacter defluvii]RXI32236.1 cbb3-type cytochrome oxidase assembly protein CcoS [Arcobacter defluvii]
MKNKIYDIVIIGGGPGGIGCAIEASAHKIGNILLIEKTENHSNTIRKFYKDNKRVDKDYKGQVITLQGNVDFFDGTKETTLDYFNDLLDNEKIDSIFNTEVEKITRNQETDLLEVHTSKGLIQTKNAIVAIGKMGKPNKPDYKIPPSIKSQVGFNLDRCSSNEKILVVGGGNSAAEYAYHLADQNNNVTLVYRKPTFTRLNDLNEELLNKYNGEEKLRLRMNTDIESLENEEGKVKVLFTDGFTVLYDRIIYAIGGTTPIDFLKACGIEVDEDLKPIFDKHQETTAKDIYVAGDIAFASGGSIAIALNHGYHIVNNILRKRGEIFSFTENFSK